MPRSPPSIAPSTRRPRCVTGPASSSSSRRSRTRSARSSGGSAKRYSVAVFPFVEGRSGAFGPWQATEEQRAIAGLLGRLHDATEHPRRASPTQTASSPSRGAEGLLKGALRRPRSTVDDRAVRRAGARPAPRRGSARGAPPVRVRRAWSSSWARLRPGRVVTHGEPHPGNVLRMQAGGLRLVDWDTVRLAPPERDLWMVFGRHERPAGSPSPRPTARRSTSVPAQLYASGGTSATSPTSSACFAGRTGEQPTPRPPASTSPGTSVWSEVARTFPPRTEEVVMRLAGTCASDWPSRPRLRWRPPPRSRPASETGSPRSSSCGEAIFPIGYLFAGRCGRPLRHHLRRAGAGLLHPSGRPQRARPGPVLHAASDLADGLPQPRATWSSREYDPEPSPTGRRSRRSASTPRAWR